MQDHTETLRLEFRPDGVAVIVMDDPGESVNTLKRELAAEFEALLEDLERRQDLQAVVFLSGKPDSFIVGADLEMLRGVDSAVEASALSRTLQDMQSRLVMLPAPTVVAIHGNCLGGGLELALSFDARIASDHDQTRLGLPEVQLGLLPGGGGTQRLPRIIGVKAALDLMLTGRQLRARDALRIGLVDELVDKSELLDAAVRRGLALADFQRRDAPVPVSRPLDSLLTPAGLMNYLLTETALGRHILFSQASKAILKKTRGHYPAPERILEVVRTGLKRGMGAGLAAETKAFGELAVSNEARELINIFFATTALKKESGVVDASVSPRQLRKVGILGAGFMGAGIGFVTAYRAEIMVCFKDSDADSAARGLDTVRSQLETRVNRRRMEPAARDRVLARLSSGEDYAGLEDADVVIEAVFEDLDLKHRMVREVEALNNDRLIFATNTSSIPVSRK